MAVPQKLPPVSELQAMTERGMTHQEIADSLSANGERVAKSSVSAALSRAGLSSVQPRYADEIPWRVRGQHAQDYGIKMLRLLGRRRAGTPNTAADDKALDSWVRRLGEKGLIAAYGRHCGLIYVPTDEQAAEERELGIPIRRKAVTAEEYEPGW